MTMLIAFVTLAWCIGVLLTAMTVLRFLDRQHVQRRVFESSRVDESPLVDPANRTGIARWLLLAGYRRPGAAVGFVAAVLAALAFGATLAYVVWISGVLAAADRAIAVIPGGLSNLARPMLLGVPWMLLLMASA